MVLLLDHGKLSWRGPGLGASIAWLLVGLRVGLFWVLVSDLVGSLHTGWSGTTRQPALY